MPELKEHIESSNVTYGDLEDAKKDAATREHILAECFNSLALFSKVMFPERFHLGFSRQHYQFIEVLDDDTIPRAVITAWRGGGKSSLILAKIARDIIFRMHNFVMWASKSATHAEIWTDNLKLDMLTSKRMKQFKFGSMRTKKIQDYDQGFSRKNWVASFPGDDNFQTLVLPRGAKQQFRGIAFGRHRVGLLALDDFEDDEEVENEELRKKNKKRFITEISETIPQHEQMKGETAARILYIDTIKHEDALICYLLESKAWVHVKLELCTDKLISLAPSFMSTKKIKEKYDYYEEQGELDGFAREFMCQPIHKESAAFQQAMFRYYDEADQEFTSQRGNLVSIVIVDPAKTSKMESAESGVVCWGINTQNDKMHFRYGEGRKVTPDQLYTWAFETAHAFGAFIIGVESSGLGDFVMHPIRNEAFRLGYNFEIIELKAKRGRGEFSGEGGGKKARVASLIPFFRRGLVLLNKHACQPFIFQLLGYPRSKRWDIMDPAGYITEIMETYAMYFQPAAGDGDPYETEDEFKDMSDDFKDHEFRDEELLV